MGKRRKFPFETIEDKKNRYLNIPIKNRTVEKYINPYESFWQKDIMMHFLTPMKVLSLKNK